MRNLVHRAALAAALTVLTACADAPTQPGSLADLAKNAKAGRGGGAAGTTLGASKSATGFHERQTEYDWSIEKRVKAIMDESMIPLPSTSTAELLPRSLFHGPNGNDNIKWVDYVIVATRGATPTVTTTAGVRGEICVDNDGDRPTEGLAIRDVVQRKAGDRWEDVRSAAVDVSAKPVLGAGEQHCYPYEVPLPPTPGEYRNTAYVTITNHSGHLGQPFGPAFNGGGIKAGFSIAGQPTPVTLDEQAMISDPRWSHEPPSYTRGGCAELWPIFFCTQFQETGLWTVSSSETIEFMVDIGNLYGCSDTYLMKNTAQLVESGRGDFGPLNDTHFATTTIAFTTPDCGARTAPVRSVDFWRQGTSWPPHQFWGPTFRIQDYQFFDSGASWLQEMRIAPRTAYERLAQQFMAATLNFMSGAPVPRSVLDVRTQAGSYFASWPVHRAAVPDAQLDEWARILAAYNSGVAP